MKSEPIRKYEEDDEENGDRNEVNFEEIQVFADSDTVLNMTRLPWSIWIFSISSIIGGSLLIANLANPQKIFNKFYEGFWWQYFVVAIMYVVAVVFFLCGKVEIVSFNKENGLLSQNKWILCYKWRGATFPLTDVTNVTLQKEGIKNNFQDTIHYKVLISLKQALPLRILETKNKENAIEKVSQIRLFLNMSEDVQIRDMSGVS